MTGIELIDKERERQINELGYDVRNDSFYSNNELAKAATCYLLTENFRICIPGTFIPINWPWAGEYWKPCPNDRIRELTKAGALFKAQAERDNSERWDSYIKLCAGQIDLALKCGLFINQYQ